MPSWQALAAAAPPHIARSDLSGTAVTDASAAALRSMTSLKTLRLANTRMGDATLSGAGAIEIAALADRDRNESHATKSALAPLAAEGRGHLRGRQCR